MPGFLARSEAIALACLALLQGCANAPLGGDKLARDGSETSTRRAALAALALPSAAAAQARPASAAALSSAAFAPLGKDATPEQKVARANELDLEAVRLRAEAARLKSDRNVLSGALVGAAIAGPPAASQAGGVDSVALGAAVGYLMLKLQMQERASQYEAEARKLNDEASRIRAEAEAIPAVTVAVGALQPPLALPPPPVATPEPKLDSSPPRYRPPPAIHFVPSPTTQITAVVPVGNGDTTELDARRRARFTAEAGKIDELVTGSVAVSAPQTAKEGEHFFVNMRVSPQTLSALLSDVKAEFPENTTVKGKDNVKLTPRMSATVSGFGFEVTPKEGLAQGVSATEPTNWQWEVKALESGPQTLTFTLSGVLTIEGKEVSRDFYRYQQKVQVEVSPMSMAMKNWQWLASSVVIPAVGALWALFRKPKGSDGTRRSSIADKIQERRRLRAALG